MNRICLSTTFVEDQSSLNYALGLCDEAKISAVEIGSNHCYEPDYSYVKDYSFEYLVHNYFPVPKESFVVNIASLDEKNHRRSITHIKNAIDFQVRVRTSFFHDFWWFLVDFRVENRVRICIFPNISEHC